MNFICVFFVVLHAKIKPTRVYPRNAKVPYHHTLSRTASSSLFSFC